VLRYRRSGGEERQQIKWIAFAASVVVVLYAIAMIVSFVFPEESWTTAGSVWWLNLLTYAVLSSFTLVPIAVGIAVLKYRLYEIDIIINRALVYVSLTATLVAVYLGGVVLLQRLFVLLTGQRSTLAVVASTLLIAALFNPLRGRIQGFVDRRFYRRKYDATKTLAAFNARLREETGLVSERRAGGGSQCHHAARACIFVAAPRGGTEGEPPASKPYAPQVRGRGILRTTSPCGGSKKFAWSKLRHEPYALPIFR
jgi:hypothetical protein